MTVAVVPLEVGSRETGEPRPGVAQQQSRGTEQRSQSGTARIQADGDTEIPHPQGIAEEAVKLDVVEATGSRKVAEPLSEATGSATIEGSGQVGGAAPVDAGAIAAQAGAAQAGSPTEAGPRRTGRQEAALGASGAGEPGKVGGTVGEGREERPVAGATATVDPTVADTAAAGTAAAERAAAETAAAAEAAAGAAAAAKASQAESFFDDDDAESARPVRVIPPGLDAYKREYFNKQRAAEGNEPPAGVIPAGVPIPPSGVAYAGAVPGAAGGAAGGASASVPADAVAPAGGAVHAPGAGFPPMGGGQIVGGAMGGAQLGEVVDMGGIGGGMGGMGGGMRGGMTGGMVGGMGGQPPEWPRRRQTGTDKSRYNYASANHGAKIVDCSSEAKRPQAVLDEDKDKYLRIPCSVANKFLVIELSEFLARIETIVLANYEFYASSTKDFEVWASRNYPSDRWHFLGNFSAQSVRTPQAFEVTGSGDLGDSVRYVMVRQLSHHGAEFFCTLSLVRVHGVNELDGLREEMEAMTRMMGAGRQAMPAAPPGRQGVAAAAAAPTLPVVPQAVIAPVVTTPQAVTIPQVVTTPEMVTTQEVITPQVVTIPHVVTVGSVGLDGSVGSEGSRAVPAQAEGSDPPSTVGPSEQLPPLSVPAAAVGAAAEAASAAAPTSSASFHESSQPVQTPHPLPASPPLPPAAPSAAPPKDAAASAASPAAAAADAPVATSSESAGAPSNTGASEEPGSTRGSMADNGSSTGAPGAIAQPPASGSVPLGNSPAAEAASGKAEEQSGGSSRVGVEGGEEAGVVYGGVEERGGLIQRGTEREGGGSSEGSREGSSRVVPEEGVDSVRSIGGSGGRNNISGRGNVTSGSSSTGDSGSSNATTGSNGGSIQSGGEVEGREAEKLMISTKAKGTVDKGSVEGKSGAVAAGEAAGEEGRTGGRHGVGRLGEGESEKLAGKGEGAGCASVDGVAGHRGAAAGADAASGCDAGGGVEMGAAVVGDGSNVERARSEAGVGAGVWAGAEASVEAGAVAGGEGGGGGGGGGGIGEVKREGGFSAPVSGEGSEKLSSLEEEVTGASEGREAKGGSGVEGGREGSGAEEEQSDSGGDGSEPARREFGGMREAEGGDLKLLGKGLGSDEARHVAGEKQENVGDVGRGVREEVGEGKEARLGRGELEAAVGDGRGSSLTGLVKGEEKAEAEAEAEAETETGARAGEGAEAGADAVGGAKPEAEAKADPSIGSGGGISVSASQEPQGQAGDVDMVGSKAGTGSSSSSRVGVPPTAPSMPSAATPSHQGSAPGAGSSGGAGALGEGGSEVMEGSGEKAGANGRAGAREREAGEAKMDGENGGEGERVRSNVVEGGGGSSLGAAPSGGLSGSLSDKVESVQVKTAGPGVEQASPSAAAADGRQTGAFDAGGNKIQESREERPTAGDRSQREDSSVVVNRKTIENGGKPIKEDVVSLQPDTTAEVDGTDNEPEAKRGSSTTITSSTSSSTITSSTSSGVGGDASSTAAGNKETGTGTMAASGTATDATASTAVGNNGALISGAQVVTSTTPFSISSSGSSFAGAASNLYGLKSLMHMVRQWEDKQAVLEQYIEDMAASYAANLASTDAELLSLRTRLRNATGTIAGLQVQLQNAERRHGKDLEDRDFEKHYKTGKELGHGQFGTTYESIQLATDNRVAVKAIQKKSMKQPIAVEDVEREVKILQLLSGHPNVVQFIDVFEDTELVYIAMELCEGGELLDRILGKKDNRYSEKDAASVVRQMLNVVARCHLNGVVHRDLKPENFLFANKTEESPLKATDFGLSDFRKPGKHFTDVVGSAYYVAPEVLKRRSGPESDVWSIGVITYILLSGRRPFWDKTEAGIFNEVLKKKPDFREKPWPQISTSAKDFVKKLLKKDPRARPTAAQALSHPWVKEGGNASSIPLDIAVLSNMREFVKYSRLKQMALKALATTLESTEVQQLRDQFNAMDINGDGTITIDEIRHALNKDLPYEVKETKVVQILQAMDTNCDGIIDFDEFVAATLHVQQLEEADSAKWEERSKAAFNHFDTDGDGFIDAEELRVAAQVKGSLGRLIDEGDVDGDGRISLPEFQKLLRCASINSRTNTTSRSRGRSGFGAIAE
ncbi:unnamed protein product [Closterium sp. Naga37s-1]|nr:unnamed protein product [Closterium sp. Naga37s-1]